MAVKLRESSIDQILPLWLAEKPEVQALGYAIMKANQKMLDLLDQSMVYAGIDRLPEKILDVLAIELRAQYYEEDLEIESKRKIIKNTLYLYSKAGTPEAVTQMISQVFGGGVMAEWFEYGGEPYHFKVDTSAIMSEDINEKFVKLIRRVKNIRSHLDQIVIKRKIEAVSYIATAQRSYTKAPVIVDGYLDNNTIESKIHVSGNQFGYTKAQTITDAYIEKNTARAIIYGAGAVENYTIQAVITE